MSVVPETLRRRRRDSGAWAEVNLKPAAAPQGPAACRATPTPAPDSTPPLVVRDGCAGPCTIVKPSKDERPLAAGGDPRIVVDSCSRRAC
jgi:hypothetical protein